MKSYFLFKTLFSGLIFFISCESNALKQDLAEKSIRNFIEDHLLLTPEELISLQTIQKIFKADVFTEHKTRINVLFKTEHSVSFTLRFIFSRTPKDQWYLESIQPGSGDLPTLINDWLSDKKQLKIQVQ